MKFAHPKFIRPFVASVFLFGTNVVHAETEALREQTILKEELKVAELRKQNTRSVVFSGLAEAELNLDKDSSNIEIATIELAADAVINQWVTAYMLMSYESGNANNNIQLKEGVITIENQDQSNAYLMIGRQYLPFGHFETMMISDPLTLELAETSEEAINIGYRSDSVYGSVYAFNGDVATQDEINTGNNKISNFGATLGAAIHTERLQLHVGFDYTSNLADSDTLQDNITHLKRKIAGYAVHTIINLDELVLAAEYLSATEQFTHSEVEFKGEGAKPSAYNLELGYRFNMLNQDSIIAVGAQGTAEAAALNLPESKMLITFSTEIANNTHLSLEYAKTTSYDKNQGDNNVVILQLAALF